MFQSYFGYYLNNTKDEKKCESLEMYFDKLS